MDLVEFQLGTPVPILIPFQRVFLLIPPIEIADKKDLLGPRRPLFEGNVVFTHVESVDLVAFREFEEPALLFVEGSELGDKSVESVAEVALEWGQVGVLFEEELCVGEWRLECGLAIVLLGQRLLAKGLESLVFLLLRFYLWLHVTIIRIWLYRLR